VGFGTPLSGRQLQRRLKRILSWYRLRHHQTEDTPQVVLLMQQHKWRITEMWRYICATSGDPEDRLETGRDVDELARMIDLLILSTQLCSDASLRRSSLLMQGQHDTAK